MGIFFAKIPQRTKCCGQALALNRRCAKVRSGVKAFLILFGWIVAWRFGFANKSLHKMEVEHALTSVVDKTQCQLLTADPYCILRLEARSAFSGIRGLFVETYSCRVKVNNSPLGAMI